MARKQKMVRGAPMHRVNTRITKEQHRYITAEVARLGDVYEGDVLRTLLQEAIVARQVAANRN